MSLTQKAVAPSRATALELRRQFSLPYHGRQDAVTLAEIERRLGKARKWCSRRAAGLPGSRPLKNWEALIERDGMPAPIASIGSPTFERNAMEAWFARNDPMRPKLKAANDFAPVTRNTDDAWDRALEAEYGRKEIA